MDKRILVEIFKRTVSGLAIVAVLLFVPLPAIIKSLLLLIFLIYLAYRVSNLLVTDPESRMTQIALGLIVILAWLIISLSLCFYLDQISRPAVLICFIPLILLASGQQQIKSKTKNTNRQPTRSIWSLGLTAGVVIGDAVLLLAYLIARTSEPLRTPWDVIPWPALLLFGVTTWLLFLICHERRGIGRYSLTALHLFTAYSLAEIVIACGFGFDPFIHRTAEAYIAEHGFILPKQPYYTGQYVIVVALKWLTGLSIDSIDRWLVLVLGPLTLPWIIPLGLKRAWKITDQSTSFWTPIILLLPLSPLIFTVPYSLSFLILIWLVFLAPLIRKRWRDRLLILGLSLAMLAIHPLLGAVAIGLVTALLLPTWLNSWLTGLV
ncbi:hypothetical protein KKC47_04105, partial [Patescibacteria group bacterium]|nr:hypothetical protein [Patescibacteria group bacterium]